MKKVLSILTLALMLLVVCTGCGKKGGSDSVSVDVTKLGQDLVGTVESELKEVNSEIISSTYFIDLSKVEESFAALNSGANACEVVVLKCADSKYVSEAQDLFKTRVESQSTLFADYNAPEVAKLDKAVIKTAGNYIVYCVTDDVEAAEKLVKEAGF